MSRARGIALAVVTAALFGSIPIGGKLALQGLSALFLPFALLLATWGLLVAFLALVQPRTLATLRQPPRLLWPMGVALGFNHVLYYTGLFRTTATATEIIIQLAPLFLVAFGVMFFRERFGPRKAAGTGLAVAGVVAISWNGDSLAAIAGSTKLLGNLLVAGAALLWALYAAGQKVANRSHPPQAVLAGVYLVGAVAALPVAVAGWPTSVPVASWAGLLWLALATVGSFGAFAQALEHADASTLAVVTTTAPLFTIAYVLTGEAFAPWLVPGETITVWTWAGALFVVVGVALVSRERVPLTELEEE